MGLSVDEVYDLTKIDKWFLVQIEEIVKIELDLDRLCDEKGEGALAALDADTLRVLKKKGFSDRRLAKLLKTNEKAVREARRALNVRPVYKRVDTCAAEFPTNTAYMYSTYEEECEAEPSSKKKIMVLGGGPNRIGQGIEFDYCCVHAALAMREDGYE
ncbi:carbamoyl phosphate synthase large subunit, partial [Corynebacterium sp. 35RC1]|nr:carbamoyl phosphate synthase large subunit [Corynebacterium sp. 35RC1]